MTANPFNAQEPGYVSLTPSRFVYYTGKVAIGLRFEPQQRRELGVNAELMQRVMTSPLPRVWHETPRRFFVKPSLWSRLVRMVRA